MMHPSSSAPAEAPACQEGGDGMGRSVTERALHPLIDRACSLRKSAAVWLVPADHREVAQTLAFMRYAAARSANSA
jgi:hypothetical protein